MNGDWRDRALCLGLDPELWFPEPGTSPKAKRVCAACPVRAECLAFALAIDAAGIWGGLSQKQRHALPAARMRPCKRCGKLARLPVRFCSDDCRQLARRKVQADSEQRRRAAA